MDRRLFLGACGRGGGIFLLAAAGCSKFLPTEAEEEASVGREIEGVPLPLAVGPPWEDNIKSEAYYSLCELRNGTSHKVYQGLAMGDWDYPHSDPGALARCTSLSGGVVGPLGLWNGQYRQGGWCKFFVNMILYRSSYGYPGGHLYLKTGYQWEPYHAFSEAQPGWILQSASVPHTAVVVKRMPNGGLDVIDSNWIGTYRQNGQYVYSYAIGRHEFSRNQLTDKGFRAYRAHEICRLVS